LPQRRRAWLAEALIVAGLMLLPLLFWWRLWALNPANRAAIPQGDFTSQYYPLQLFSARELAAGRVPGWDPYLNAGQPGLADIQTGFFYPFNLLPNLILAAAGLPFTLGLLTAQVVFHFSLASLFTYLFVRHLARRAGARTWAARFAGAVAALSFTYSGYLTSFPVQQLTILETAVWLPLVLFFLDRACHHARPLPQIVLAGLALACMFLAGHPQTAMYVVYTALAYGLFLQALRRPRNLWVYLWRAGYTVLLPLLLGVALAAVQLGPTLAFIAHSTRAGLDYQAVSWGFPLVELTHLLYPGYFGGSPQYVGVLPPILAVAALFVRRARREVVFWVVFAVVALLLALGGHTFFYNLAYLLAPGFAAVRDQQRIIFLFSFAVSVLAGYGGLVLVQPLERPARRGFRRFVRGLVWVGIAFTALTAVWYLGYLQGLQQAVEVNLFEGVLRHHAFLLLILGGSAALFALRLTGKAKRPSLMTLALALIWLNLFTVNWQFNLADPVAGGPYPQTGLVSFLKGQPGTFRISSAGLLPGGSSAGVVYELEDITGNTPLRLEAFQQFEEQVGSWRRWQLLNVEYVLSRDDIAGPGLEQVYEEAGVKAYRVGDPLPRAWVVYRTTIADDGQAFDLLNAEDFDPRAIAVLPPDRGQPPTLASDQVGSAAQVVQAEPGRLVLDVSSSAEGMLVISQPFYPGWQAKVDGERVLLHRVDYLLQGVPLGPGSHRVELSYHLSLLPAILSLAVLAACVAALILSRPRKAPGEPQ
jgi:Bacterial membrane protein YfhO